MYDNCRRRLKFDPRTSTRAHFSDDADTGQPDAVTGAEKSRNGHGLRVIIDRDFPGVLGDSHRILQL